MDTLLRLAFNLEAVYALTGLVLLVFATLTFLDRQHPHRLGTGIFWLLLGIIFIFGGVLPHWVTGCLVLGMVAVDGAGRVRPGPGARPAERVEPVRQLDNRIFLPVLIIPAMTFLFAAASRMLGQDVNRGTLVGLGYGGLMAMLVALGLTRASPRRLFEEGRRLNETMGAVNILPQLLASLGLIFTAAKVGELIAGAIVHAVPEHNLFLLVLASCLSMAFFTIVMGNSFAAFPVIATGVLVPLIIEPFHVDPALAGILTLTAGSSGTLMTPMAANFNIIPVALLNMRDQYGVIRFQLPFALAIWSLHVVVLWALIRLTAG
jgi:uncharacterized membrane protein